LADAPVDDPVNAYDELERARRDLGWSVETLWLAYAGLGGRCSLSEVGDHLAAQSGLTARQYDYLAQALNDQFVGRGHDHPVPYAESFGRAVFDVE